MLKLFNYATKPHFTDSLRIHIAVCMGDCVLKCPQGCLYIPTRHVLLLKIMYIYFYQYTHYTLNVNFILEIFN